MERETKTLKTPAGHTIEYFAYLTGKESRVLQSQFMAQTDISASDDGSKPKVQFKAGAILEVQGAALKILIVSVNGNKEGAVEAVDNMPVSEYNAIIKELNTIIEPVFFDKNDFLGQSSTKQSA